MLLLPPRNMLSCRHKQHGDGGRHRKRIFPHAFPSPAVLDLTLVPSNRCSGTLLLPTKHCQDVTLASTRFSAFWRGFMCFYGTSLGFSRLLHQFLTPGTYLHGTSSSNKMLLAEHNLDALNMQMLSYWQNWFLCTFTKARHPLTD